MAKGYGMWDVLRSHAIGKLEREDPETLKEFQTVIGARIKAIDNALEHTNHFNTKLKSFGKPQMVHDYPGSNWRIVDPRITSKSRLNGI